MQAQQAIVTSPDGKLTVNLKVNNGTPTYSVSYKGKLFLEPSPIGLKTNIGDFSGGLELKEKQIQNNVDEYVLRSKAYKIHFAQTNAEWYLIFKHRNQNPWHVAPNTSTTPNHSALRGSQTIEVMCFGEDLAQAPYS